MTDWQQWLTTGASLATLLGLAVTVAVVVREERVRSRQELRDRAETIRGQLTTVRDSFARVDEYLLDQPDASSKVGATLVAGAVAVAEQYRRLLSATSGSAAAELRRLVENDDDGALASAIATSGWWSSPLSVRADAVSVDLTLATAGLPGQLQVMVPASRLLRRIVDETQSPKIFQRMLHGDVGAQLAVDIADGDGAEVTRNLGLHLAGTAAQHYKGFQQATEALRRMVNLIVSGLMDASDERLVELARYSPPGDTSGAGTFTGELRTRLEPLARDLEPSYQEIVTQLALIEEHLARIGKPSSDTPQAGSHRPPGKREETSYDDWEDSACGNWDSES